MPPNIDIPAPAGDPGQPRDQPEGRPVSVRDPSQTLMPLPDEIPWKGPDNAPANSVAEAVLAGGEDQEGIYLVLMKGHPGWVGAPHPSGPDRLGGRGSRGGGGEGRWGGGRPPSRGCGESEHAVVPPVTARAGASGGRWVLQVRISRYT